MLAVWTSRRVSPRANRAARKRSPGLDWRFVMTLPLSACNVPAEAKTLWQRHESHRQKPSSVGGTAHEAWESKMDHNDRACSPIGVKNRRLFWIANSTKRRVLQVRASAARCVGGRPARRTFGLAPAEMNGTRSTPEASAQPASISGLQRNASPARAGRRIRIGMCLNSGCKLCVGRVPWENPQGVKSSMAAAP